MPRTTPLMLVVALHLVACGSTVKAGEPDGTTDAVEETNTDVATEPGDDPAPDGADDPGGDPATDPGGDPATDTGPARGDVGDPCTSRDDCTELPGEARFCATELPMGPGGTLTFPGGYCSMGCFGDDGCGEGAWCLPNPMGSEGMCVKLCDDESDCRVSEGYTCMSMPGPTPSPTFCFPPMW